MRFGGGFAVRSPQDRVWSFFLSPEELSSCIEDPHNMEVVDANNFRGQVKSGVGFIKGTFSWSARIVERTPSERARIQMHGTGMGSAFDIDSVIEMSESAGVTTVRWQADVVMNGTIASVGARLLHGTIDKKTNEFFENARRKLEGS